MCACACVSALNQIELDIGDGGGEAGGQRCPRTMSGAGSLAPLLEPGPGSRLLLVTQLVSIGIGIRASNDPSRIFHSACPREGPTMAFSLLNTEHLLVLYQFN